MKQGSQIAPRRRGGRRVNKFLFKNFSELCDLIASVVNTSSQENRNNVTRVPQQKLLLLLLYLATVFRLFQERLKPAESTKKTTARDNAKEFNRIRCPLCKWRPKASSRWYCGDCDYPEYFFDGCGTAWNTFKTRGLCPGCGHQWHWTICLSCQRWSRHEEWYENQA